ncbi:MAG: hypothetical protein ACKOHK_08885, partial [Planctomycetia bacterium]
MAFELARDVRIQFSRRAGDVGQWPALAAGATIRSAPPMQRVPNPPKVPLPFATVTKSRRSLLAGATSKGRTALAIAVLLSAAFSTMSASTTGLAAAEPGSSITGGQQAVHAAPHNFLVHGTSPARGRVIREHAESMRRDLFAKLLGEPDPAPWRARCEIRVHTTAEAFAAAVGGPPADARGAT